jgi:hypothetical protein
MRTAVLLVGGLFLTVLVACSSAAPVAIRSGDICDETHQPIQNVKLAAEIVTSSGQALKFRTVSAMAQYLHEHAAVPGGTLFVTDYPTGQLIPVETAIFVKGQIDDNSKALDYYAFGNVKAAVAFGDKTGESTTDWPSVRENVATGTD